MENSLTVLYSLQSSIFIIERTVPRSWSVCEGSIHTLGLLYTSKERTGRHISARLDQYFQHKEICFHSFQPATTQISFRFKILKGSRQIVSYMASKEHEI